MSDLVEKTARAIWAHMREHEDRCDMELEDMGKNHVVWDMARAAVEAIAPTWQPIETAPKDGTEIDIFTHHGERVTNAKWMRGKWMQWGRNDYGDATWVTITGQATHWKPLPDEPESTQ